MLAMLLAALDQTIVGTAEPRIIAQLAGFGTAAVMRHHFLKVLQTTPTAYRRAFSCRLDESMAS